RVRRRELSNELYHLLQIALAKARHQLVHQLDDRQPVPKHEQLNSQVERRLPSQGGHFWCGRLPLLAVTGEAGCEPGFERVRTGRKRGQRDEHAGGDAAREAREDESRVAARPRSSVRQRLATLSPP